MKAFDIGMKLLGVAAMVPEIASWLRKAASQDDSEISQRVSEILPPKGAAETALERLESEPPTTLEGA